MLRLRLPSLGFRASQRFSLSETPLMSLRLEVRTDNRAATALYGAHGDAQVGLVPRHYADRQDAYRFSKTL